MPNGFLLKPPEIIAELLKDLQFLAVKNSEMILHTLGNSQKF
jgi:hypothetical protein